MARLAGHLHHTWALLERTGKPSMTALTEALLTDWANDPQAVDLELILAELRASSSSSGPDFSAQLGHLVWWSEAKVACTHLALETGERSALGTAFELGIVLIQTEAKHPHLQEASLSDLHETWVRFKAGDDAARAVALREQLVVLVVVEGDGALAPDVYVIARRQPGENNESPPPIGVIPVRLHAALERAQAGRMRRNDALDRELQGLAGLIAKADADSWRDNFPAYDRKRYVDRFRLELRVVLETAMALLEQAAGEQARTPEQLAELREAASILVFRVFFVVAMERRGLLYAKPPRPERSFRGLTAAGDEAKDSAFLHLQDVTAAIRVSSSPTRRRRRLGVTIKHASIFRNLPTSDFGEGLAVWLDALDTATQALAKNPAKLREWDSLMARLEPLALGQIQRYEFEAQDVDTLGGGARHVQRVLGDVYEQILGMIPVRAGKGKSSRVQLTLKGKPRGAKEDVIEPADRKQAKALERAAKSERKSLGAHYTPEALVIEVVLAALEPVFAAAWERAGKNPKRYREELLDLRVVDPAMGSAHFLTVAALEIAREIAWSEYYGSPRTSDWFEVWPEEWTEDYEHHADPWDYVESEDREELDRIAARNLQAVAESCCHGVDVKPLAVELGKLALWMLTMVERQERGVEADTEAPPLTFVDKNLRCGDSLRGVDEQTVKDFFAEVYGMAGRDQLKLFASETDDDNLDDVLRCLFRLHEVLGKGAEEVVDEAAGLLATAGQELGRELKPVSHEPQELRVQLHEVARELSERLRWTWDLAFLYDWYGQDKDVLWEALTEERQTTAESWVALLGGPGKFKRAQRFYRDRVREIAAKSRAFHWSLEFYGVFHRSRPGFDVVVANPPFLGDRRLRGSLGSEYVTYLRRRYTDGGTPDLCGFFLLLISGTLLNEVGVIGLVGPNTLAQAKNRRVAIAPLTTTDKVKVLRACPSRHWPGEDASLHILVVHLCRPGVGKTHLRPRRIAPYESEGMQNSARVHVPAQGPISSYLDEGPDLEMERLPGRDGVIFMGFNLRGEGHLTFDVEELESIPDNEKPALAGYINAELLQQHPSPKPKTVAIDFLRALESDKTNFDTAKAEQRYLKRKFPKLWERCSPLRIERAKLKGSGYTRAREYWWRFDAQGLALRRAIESLEGDTAICLGSVVKVLKPVLVPILDPATGLPFCPTHMVFVIPSAARSMLAAVSSLLFEAYARRACSSLETRLRLAPREVFPYFPFPWPAKPFPDNPHRAPVLNVPTAVERRLTPPTQALLDLREDILLHPERHELTRAEVGGPTDLYNLFDNPKCELASIQRLRDAHQAVESAVLREYGWEDLHGPWTFDRPWIDGTWRFVPPAATRRAYLERLAALNHEQAAAAEEES